MAQVDKKKPKMASLLAKSHHTEEISFCVLSDEVARLARFIKLCKKYFFLNALAFLNFIDLFGLSPQIPNLYLSR